MDAVAAGISAATDFRAAYIDLNKASMNYLNILTVGGTNRVKHNLMAADHTYLSPAAGVVFGNLVVDFVEKSAAGAAVKGCISLNTTIVKHIDTRSFFYI